MMVRRKVGLCITHAASCPTVRGKPHLAYRLWHLIIEPLLQTTITLLRQPEAPTALALRVCARNGRSCALSFPCNAKV